MPPSVVPRALGCLARRARRHRHHRRSARYPEDTHRRVPDARVQARRDEPRVVDWSVVRPWSWHVGDVTARSRVHCQDCGDDVVDERFLARSLLAHPSGHPDVDTVR